MDSETPHSVVKIKTLDGIALEGFFFEAEGPAPVIIMSHGFNCVKEMSLGETVGAFHSANFNVLLYDARSVGGSEGSPKNQIDPIAMVGDISDVVNYAMGLPSVNPKQVLLWGMSFGAAVSGVAAAFDRRVAGVVMVCPLFSYVREDKRATLFVQLMKDRKSQLRGNDPFTLPPYNAKGENPAGFAGSGGPGGRESYKIAQAGAASGHPNFRDRITLQTYQKLAMFRPKELIGELLGTVPAMMVIPELDDMSPPDEQRAVYDSIKAPKKLFWADGQRHFAVLNGESSVALRADMIAFFRSALEDNLDNFN